MRLRVIRPKTEFIKRKVCKISGLKTGGHHAVFSVLEVKRSNISQKLNKRDCFVYILGFIFYGMSGKKTGLHNKYMI